MSRENEIENKKDSYMHNSESLLSSAVLLSIHWMCLFRTQWKYQSGKIKRNNIHTVRVVRQFSFGTKKIHLKSNGGAAITSSNSSSSCTYNWNDIIDSSIIDRVPWMYSKFILFAASIFPFAFISYTNSPWWTKRNRSRQNREKAAKM